MTMKSTLLLTATLAAFGLAGQAQAILLVDDTFDDGALGVNTSGIGTGFASNASGGGAAASEAGGFAIMDSPLNGGRRTVISSNEAADTTTALEITYLFEDVVWALSADDTGDGATNRNSVGVRNAGGVNGNTLGTPGEGFYVNFNNPGVSSGAVLTDSYFFHLDDAGTSTILAQWTFDNLAFIDGDAAAVPPVVAEVTPAPGQLDVTIQLDGTGWALDITGDTQGGGSPISFSGAHTGYTNAVTTGHALAGTQSESPNLMLSLGRVEIDLDIGILGDFDGSGVVDEADFLILNDNLAGELDGAISYFDGDIDFDSDIDLDDFGQFKGLFPGVVASALGAPEPTTFGLLALASGLLASVRSRRAGC